MTASVVRDEPAPREIVAWLHAEIAAKSPEHAALVAAFERIPYPGQWGHKRMDISVVHAAREYMREACRD